MTFGGHVQDLAGKLIIHRPVVHQPADSGQLCLGAVGAKKTALSSKAVYVQLQPICRNRYMNFTWLAGSAKSPKKNPAYIREPERMLTRSQVRTFEHALNH